MGTGKEVCELLVHLLDKPAWHPEVPTRFRPQSLEEDGAGLTASVQFPAACHGARPGPGS